MTSIEEFTRLLDLTLQNGYEILIFRRGKKTAVCEIYLDGFLMLENRKLGDPLHVILEAMKQLDKE